MMDKFGKTSILANKCRDKKVFFTNSRPLLESIGSSRKIKEKALRQSVAYLKQSLEEGKIMGNSWIQGEEIVADVFTKQGSTRDM